MNPLASPVLDAALPGLSLMAALIATLPWLKREDTWARAILGALAIGLTWRYITWRCTSSLPPFGFTAEWAWGLIFLAAELFTIAGVTVTCIILMRVRNRSGDVNANMNWLLTRPSPATVDVFICTYNEGREILERTILGALAMDYASHRVWILDDGRRPWLKRVCAEIGCGYIDRPDNSHAKAGNINHALGVVARLTRPPDYVAILDADFVPAPSFLTRALCLFRDKTVGLVQTPQHFINPDPLQSNLDAARFWPDEQRFFFDVVMPAKDAWGAAFCCGTSSLIRFDALQKIGGFPTSSVTEDYLVTLKLHSIGLSTVYLNERLSLGLAPEGLKEYITQRSRWCLGLIQICGGPNGPFAWGNQLPLVHRLCLLEAFAFWAANHAFRILSILIPILYLLFDIRAVQADFVDAVSYLLPCLIAQIAFIGWVSERRVLPVLTDASQLLTATEVLKSVVVGLWDPDGQGFKVTAKGGDRSRIVVQWRLMRGFLIAIALTLAGILWAFLFDGGRHLEGSSALALFWSWYNIAVLVVTCIVCIELPRRSDDLVMGQALGVRSAGRFAHFEVDKIAGNDVRLLGNSPADYDDVVRLTFGNHEIAGTVQECGRDYFTVEINNSRDDRPLLMNHLYSVAFSIVPNAIDYKSVTSAIVSRAFR